MEKEIEMLKEGFDQKLDKMEANMTAQITNMGLQLEKYWESSNRAYESNSKTIEKISCILQEFQVMVARSYVDKDMMGHLEEEIKDRIDLIEGRNSKEMNRLEKSITDCAKENKNEILRLEQSIVDCSKDSKKTIGWLIGIAIGSPSVVYTIYNLIKAFAGN